MNKAFIFDMDGVLVDSERIWIAEEHEFMASIFGTDIANKIGNTTGVSVNTVHEMAVSHGATVERDVYVKKYDEKAASIYARAALTEKSDILVDYLVSHGFKLGLVSASRFNGIKQVLKQLPFQGKFEAVISINDVPDLRSKPAPDGYLEALRRLNADSRKSVILEDSNRGIESGKSAGCYVIGYRGLLAPGYEQTGADAYANTMDDVIRLVETRQSI